MQLTKSQLEYIDAVLIKSGVKYWDIRIEMLDHIVFGVEQEMTKGITFEQAVFLEIQKLEVAQTFKNIVANNKKTIRDKYVKDARRDFINFFLTPNTLVLYGIVLFLLFQFSGNEIIRKNIQVFILVVVAFVFVFQTLNRIKHSVHLQKSLEIILRGGSGFMALLLVSQQIESNIIEESVFVISVLVFFPVIYVSVALFIKQQKKYNSIYKKMVSL
jgi:hypothetical protein